MDKPSGTDAPETTLPSIRRLVDVIRTNLRVREDSTPIYIDLEGHLDTISRRQHQVVFGRRGSGKSSLLLSRHSLSAGATHTHSVYFSADLIKRTSFPDAVAWLVLTIIRSLPSSSRGRGRALPRLLAELEALVSEENELEIVRQQADGASSNVGATFGAGRQGLNVTSAEQQSITTTATFRSQKGDLLERRLPDYSAEIARAIKGAGVETGFFMLDDLYLLPREWQPDVIDYLHRMLNGTGMFLKIATVRHRTQLNRLEGVFIGVELGQDIEAIDLDLTLERPDRTSNLLTEILDTLAGQVGLASFSQHHVTERALGLLVMASGGVARDFLELFCRTCAELSSERTTIQTEHVAGTIADYWTVTKLPALREELATSEPALLETVFTDIRRFCLQEARTPVFGILRSDLLGVKEISAAIAELVDLKFIHLLRRSAELEGRDEEAALYLLDLSAYNFLEEAIEESRFEGLLPGELTDPMPVSFLYMLSHAQLLVSALIRQSDPEEVLHTDSYVNMTPSEPSAKPLMSSAERRPTAEQEASPHPVRRRLPRTRPSLTISFTVGGAEGYVTAGRHTSGELGEVRIALGKQGSTLAGVMDGFSAITSIALQYGVPLEVIVAALTNLRFEPAGLTDDPDVRMAQSIFDYIFRRLALDHLDFDSRSTLGIYSAEERQQQLGTGSYLPRSPGEDRASKESKNTRQ